MKNVRKPLKIKAVVVAIAVIFIAGAFTPAIGSNMEKTVISGSIEKTNQVTNQLKPEDNPGPSPLDAGDPWWDMSWQYRKEITVNHSKVAADLTNFPVASS